MWAYSLQYLPELTSSVAYRTLVTLRSGSPTEIADMLRRLPDVEVVADAPDSAVVAETGVTPVDPRVVRADEIEGLLLAPASARKPLLLVRAVLDERSARRLEDAGVGFVDAALRSWLPGQPVSPATRQLASPLPALRSGGLRLAQLLSDHPADDWTERGLAERGRTSPVTAHHLLARLEREGHVQRHGAGRSARRRVTDVGAMRAWLLQNGRPTRIASLSCFIDEPQAIPPRLDNHLLALTGARAAERIGLPVLTAVPRFTYRVDAIGDDLERLPARLGGFRTERGANVVLIADAGRVGLSDAHEHEDALVVPPSRVMLDLCLEPRGDAAAQAFRDLWTDREINW